MIDRQAGHQEGEAGLSDGWSTTTGILGWGPDIWDMGLAESRAMLLRVGWKKDENLKFKIFKREISNS